MLAALAHGLDVIQFLAGVRGPALLGAVASAIGMSKPGTHRILMTLAAPRIRRASRRRHLQPRLQGVGDRLGVPGVPDSPARVPVMQRSLLTTSATVRFSAHSIGLDGVICT